MKRSKNAITAWVNLLNNKLGYSNVHFFRCLDKSNSTYCYPAWDGTNYYPNFDDNDNVISCSIASDHYDPKGNRIIYTIEV